MKNFQINSRKKVTRILAFLVLVLMAFQTASPLALAIEKQVTAPVLRLNQFENNLKSKEQADNLVTFNKGDVNFIDGLNTGDVTLILKHCTDIIKFSALQCIVGDMNNDEKINTGDAVGALKTVIGIINAEQIDVDISKYADYTVKYTTDAAAATDIPEEGYGIYSLPYTVSSIVPKRTDGFEFAGWLSSFDNKIYQIGESFTVSDTEKNISLSAIWNPAPQQPDSFSVTYYKGSVSGLVTNMPSAITDIPAGNVFLISSTVPECAGYTFVGWKNTVDSKTYMPGNTFVMPAQNVVLIAYWTENLSSNISVTYASGSENNDVTNMPANISDLTPGATFKIASQEPARTDFLFEGWLNSFDNKQYKAGDMFVLPETDVTLTACWTEKGNNTVSVIYLPGSIDNDVTNMPQTISELVPGATFTISNNVPARVGYEFSGWLSSQENVVFAAGDSFILPEINVTLTACWTNISQPDTYKVLYSQGDVMGAVTGMPQAAINLSAGSEYTIPTNVPLCEGFAFIGWNNSFDGTDYLPGDTIIIPTQDITLTAIWSEVAVSLVSVTYASGSAENDVTMLPATESALHSGTEYIVSEIIPVRANYEFAGWISDYDNNLYLSGTTFILPNVNVMLTAIWNPAGEELFSLIYSSGTTDPVENMPENVFGLAENSTVTISEQIPLRANYTFVSWINGTTDESILPGTEITVAKANIVLTAEWTDIVLPKKYAVSYSTGEISSANNMPSVQSIEEGATYTISENVPTAEGVVFSSWLSDFDGNTYNPGESFVMPSQNVSLTAQWYNPDASYDITLEYYDGLNNQSISTEIKTIAQTTSFTSDMLNLPEGTALLSDTPVVVTVTLSGVSSNTVRINIYPYTIINEIEYRVISTIDGLSNIRENLDKNYFLKNDISFAGQSNWTPIGWYFDPQVRGGLYVPFTGIFDGDGHTLSKVTIDYIIGSQRVYNCALFSGNMGTIKNLYLNTTTNFDNAQSYGIYASERVAGIVGTNDGTVENCHVNGYIGVLDTTTEGLAGGIAGFNSETGLIKNCSMIYSVEGFKWIGGLVGKNMGGTIEQSYFVGGINSTYQNEDCVQYQVRYIGGFTGGTTGIIRNNYIILDNYMCAEKYIGLFSGWINGGEIDCVYISNFHLAYSALSSPDPIGGTMFGLNAGDPTVFIGAWGLYNVEQELPVEFSPTIWNSSSPISYTYLPDLIDNPRYL